MLTQDESSSEQTAVNQHAQAFFETLFYEAQECMLVFISANDFLSSHCVAANHNAHSLLNYQKNEIVSLTLNKLFPVKCWNNVDNILKNITVEKKYNYPLKLLLSTGYEFNANISFSAFNINFEQYILLSFRKVDTVSDKNLFDFDYNDVLFNYYNTSSLMMGIVSLIDDDIIMMQGNLALAKFLKIDQNQLINTSWQNLKFSQDDIHLWREQLRYCINNQQSTQFEYLYLGKKIPFLHSVTITCVQRANHKSPQFSFIIEDVSERRRNAENIKEIDECYRNLIEICPDALFVMVNQRIVIINQACLSLFSAKFKSELLGKTLYDLFHPDYHVFISERTSVLFNNTDKIIIDEEKIITLDGVIVDVEVTAASFNNHGHWAIHIILRDISARKNNERLWAENYNLLKAVTDNSPDYIYIKNTKNQLVFANLPAKSLFSLKSVENINQTLVINTENPLLLDDESVLKSEKKLVTELNVIQNNNQFFYTVIKAPFFDNKGNCLGLISYLRDISNQKQQEKSRQAYLEDQHHKLVREIHHRIKNHLQGVCGLLRERIQFVPEMQQDLEIAIRQINLIARVYELQSNKIGSHTKVTDLLAIVISAMSFSADIKVNTNIEEAEVKLELSPEESVPLVLVINELLANAIKHTPPGGYERSVHISLINDNNETCLSISNEPASLPVEFDFYQAKCVKIGLDLVRWMLPPKGARLEFSENNQQVLVKLFLSSELSISNN